MPFTFQINGNTYTSDPATVVPDGYRFNGYGYISALANLAQDIVAVMSAKVSAATDQVALAAGQVTLATTQAQLAATAAASAANAPGTSATSTTSVTLATGDLSFTIQPGKAYVPNMDMKAASLTSPANFAIGRVKTYNSATGALVLTATGFEGSGTFNNWSLTLATPMVIAGALNEKKASDVACAATINLTSAAITGNLVHVTGSPAPVTAITVDSGAARTIVWDSTPTINHSANLILPGAAPIAVTAGDVWEVRGDGVGVTRVVSIETASGANRESAFKTLNAAAAISAGVMAEYLTGTDVVPWNGVLAPNVGAVITASFGTAMPSSYSWQHRNVAPNGDLLIASYFHDGTGYQNRVMRVSPTTGTYTQNVYVNEQYSSGSYHSVCGTDNGGFAVVWLRQSDGFGMVRAFNSSGVALFSSVIQFADVGSNEGYVFPAPNGFWALRQHAGAMKVTKYGYDGLVTVATATLAWLVSLPRVVKWVTLASGNIALLYVDASSSPTYQVKVSIINPATFALVSTIVVNATGGSSENSYAICLAGIGKFAVLYGGVTGATDVIRGAVYNDNGTVSTADNVIGGGSYSKYSTGYMEAYWNGSLIGLAYYNSSNNTTFMALSATLSVISNIVNIAPVNGNVKAVFLLPRITGYNIDFGVVIDGNNVTTKVAGIKTSFAGVSMAAAASGASVRVQTKGMAALASIQSAEITYDHTANIPAGVKGWSKNYTAFMV